VNIYNQSVFIIIKSTIVPDGLASRVKLA